MDCFFKKDLARHILGQLRQSRRNHLDQQVTRSCKYIKRLKSAIAEGSIRKVKTKDCRLPPFLLRRWIGRCAIGLVGCQLQAVFFVVQPCRFLREKIALPPSILAPFVSSGAQHLVEIRESLCFVGSVAVEFFTIQCHEWGPHGLVWDPQHCWNRSNSKPLSQIRR